MDRLATRAAVVKVIDCDQKQSVKLKQKDMMWYDAVIAGSQSNYYGIDRKIVECESIAEAQLSAIFRKTEGNLQKP